MTYCSGKDAYAKNEDELLNEDQYISIENTGMSTRDQRTMLGGMNHAFRLGVAAMKKLKERNENKGVEDLKEYFRQLRFGEAVTSLRRELSPRERLLEESVKNPVIHSYLQPWQRGHDILENCLIEMVLFFAQEDDKVREKMVEDLYDKQS